MNVTRAIVTGFEPYGPHTFNPTADLAVELDGRHIDGVEIRGMVLPATYFTAAGLLWETVEEFRPQRIVSLGLASRIPALRIEKLGRNITSSQYKDNANVLLSGGKIEEDGPEVARTNFDSDILASTLGSKGIPTTLSTDADGFVCNALIYQVARRIEARGGNPPLDFTFVHTPWTDQYTNRVTLDDGRIAIPHSHLEQTVLVALTI